MLDECLFLCIIPCCCTEKCDDNDDVPGNITAAFQLICIYVTTKSFNFRKMCLEAFNSFWLKFVPQT